MSALNDAQAQRAEALVTARQNLYRPSLDDLLVAATWIVAGTRLLDAVVEQPAGTAPAGDPSWTFVVAPNRRLAVEWCRRNDVQPYARTTHIVSHEHAIRGYAIRPDDRVALVDSGSVRDDVLAAVIEARRAGGSA